MLAPQSVHAAVSTQTANGSKMLQSRFQNIKRARCREDDEKRGKNCESCCFGRSFTGFNPVFKMLTAEYFH